MQIWEHIPFSWTNWHFWTHHWPILNPMAQFETHCLVWNHWTCLDSTPRGHALYLSGQWQTTLSSHFILRRIASSCFIYEQELPSRRHLTPDTWESTFRPFGYLPALLLIYETQMVSCLKVGKEKLNYCDAPNTFIHPSPPLRFGDVIRPVFGF